MVTHNAELRTRQLKETFTTLPRLFHTYDFVARRAQTDRREDDDVHPRLGRVLELVIDREELERVWSAAIPTPIRASTINWGKGCLTTHVLGAGVCKDLDGETRQRAGSELPEDDLPAVRTRSLDGEPSDDNDDEAVRESGETTKR